MPKIVVRRTDSLQDALRKYKVLVDGEVVGKVGRKKQIEAEVSPGQHEVQIKIDWGKSEPLTVDASSGEVRLVCERAGSTRDATRSATTGRGEGYVDLRQE